MQGQLFVPIAYLVAAVLFILGLKGMAHPRTAVRGNLLGVLGMAVAVGATLFLGITNLVTVAVGIIVGTVIGVALALWTPMTAMPQMVALLNGFGGGASVLVAGFELFHGTGAFPVDVLVATAASGIIGTVTFWGSMVAVGKLQELKAFRQPWGFPGQQVVNGLVAVILLYLTVYLAATDARWTYAPLVMGSTVLGLLLVLPIGGADMPVVISLLNSYSGLAAAATGFVINNNALIISGSLVGASGIILTRIMCRAMNRSLANVLFGKLEATSVASADDIYANVRSTSAEEVAMLLDTAQRVVFVPGYGMAVAQAQHAVRDLSVILEQKGITVEYAIHPVAGRMPGHMNVLLAEADISYEKLKEMDEINPTMNTVDVAIVLGANDVVNPLARTDRSSPIYGMPIIDVDKARTVVVVKRSLSPGFAGIPNPLFANDNTLMFFADGKKAMLDLVAAVKELQA